MSRIPGVRPKPTQLKILSGNPGRRPLNTREPKPKLEIPPCPPHLDDEAKKEWRKMSRELFTLGLLTRLDKAGLAGYCQAWSDWVGALEELKKSKRIVATPNGYPIQNPWFQIANKANEQMRNYLTEFGLTPASRSRIQVAPPGDKLESKLSKYLHGKQTA